MENIFKTVKLIITDIDGVLTDGELYYSESGEFFKPFFARDGLGVTILQATGIQIAALSGRDSNILRKRLQDLNIELFALGKLDKQQACLELIQRAKVTKEETLYIGDDSIDLPAFEVCGVSCTVNDAPDYIKNQVDYVTKKSGGKGAFREIADLILISQGHADLIKTASGFLSVAHKSKQ